MAAARFYSSTSGSMSLNADISAAATSMVVNSVVGLPGTTPFALVLDPGIGASEEIVDVTNVAGTTLTITRAVDGTSAKVHGAGAEVRHMATARDFREPQEHIGASAAVHGLAGTVVGTSDTQTLTNKTAQAATSATKALVVKGAASQTASFMEVQDSAGGAVLKVQPGVGTLTVGTAEVNGTGADTLFGFLARFTANATNVVSGIFKAAAAQTADILQVQNSAGTVLAKFDNLGKLTAPQVTSTGPVSGTTGTFTGQVQSGSLNVATQTGAETLTGKTIDGASNTLSNVPQASVTSLVTDLAARVRTTSAQRVHRQDYVGGTTDASGFLNIAHTAGFTPTFVQVFSRAPGASFAAAWGADTYAPAQVRVRFMHANTAGPYASAATGAFTAIFWE